MGPVGRKSGGLTEPAVVGAWRGDGAEWVGFVSVGRPPGVVTPEQASTRSRRKVGGPERVGLFVEPDDASVENTLRHVPLDILQIYATDERARHIRQRFGLPVWLSRPIATQADLPLSCPVERILVEPRPPQSATRPGGNAQRLDWSLLSGWQPPFNWMLAGGLNVDSVAQAIRTTGAPAVDVSSGVEKAPGIKDPEAIARFITHARDAAAR